MQIGGKKLLRKMLKIMLQELRRKKESLVLPFDRKNQSITQLLANLEDDKVELGGIFRYFSGDKST